MDLRDEYFHIPIAEEDLYKIVFSCRYGTFEYLVTPFGLINGPRIFYRVKNQVIFVLFNSCVVVYLYDILEFSCTKVDHVHDLNVYLKGCGRHSCMSRSQSVPYI